MKSRYKRLKKEAFEANMQLPALGLVLYTFGNVSACDRNNGVFAIKPSGVPYDELSPESMVVVDFNGNIVEGKLRPSSDTKTHALLYTQWESVNGICHTHSTYATSWAQANKDIPIFGTTHADSLTINIPCAPPMTNEKIEGDYEYETGWQIIDWFKQNGIDHNETEMVLVGNHAPFTWGNSAEKAVYNAAVLEQVAKMAFITLQINPASPLLSASLIKKHHDRKHGADAYYGQNNNNNKRK